MRALPVFIGWDSREPVAWHTLAHSIIVRASIPVALIPLRQDTLRASKFYWREHDLRASTEFSLTRFLVPALVDYHGLAIFMDCDMLCRVDLAELIAPAMQGRSRECPGEAAWVVKHDYKPRASRKFLGAANAAYPRKNWSSVIVFNAERCRALTLDYVNTASPAELHRFAWTEDWRIGALPFEWNVLVGEENQSTCDPNIVHFTNGGPWHGVDDEPMWSKEWLKEKQAATGAS